MTWDENKEIWGFYQLSDELVKSYLSFKENDSISCFSSIINCSESPMLPESDPELRFEAKGIYLSCAILIETRLYRITQQHRKNESTQLLFTRKMWKFIAVWIFPV